MFSIIKFLSGFAFWKGDKLGKILFYGVLIVLALTIYHKAFEPKQITKVERIETQIINQCPKESGLFHVGINLFGLKLKLGI